jgi:hypothetical protein
MKFSGYWLWTLEIIYCFNWNIVHWGNGIDAL